MSEEKRNILNTINSPDDLKKVPEDDLIQLCKELREKIIDECSEHPGHFGAGLGVVELTVALHYVFDAPYDNIVWDVGHQAYPHKILTGRRDNFSTNRQYKGLSGFPKRSESKYDAFGTGHSSTSISAALGMAVAAKMNGEEDRQSVAIIGDGAMTGGLAFEGLNNAGINNSNLLVILNDNNMAIDPNVGVTGKVIVPEGKMIDLYDANDIEAAGITKLKIRSLLTCRAKIGVCAHCYGSDMANGEPVQLGESIGVIAAESIGEPGTQLTMRTFHTGGIASAEDITQGLPRVEELFESRRPKSMAIMSEISGVVSQDDTKKNVVIKVTGKDENGAEVVKSYSIPFTQHSRVMPGDRVEKGDIITREGVLYPQDILAIKGLEDVQNYLINEVQKVYRLQGVEINDKHIEVIVRQMCRKVRVTDSGSSDLIGGALANRLEVENINAELQKRIDAGEQGIKLVEYQQVLLGITKAALANESFLSAASFQETTRVLTEAAIKGKVDPLAGLKENVIIGKLIPAGTGLPEVREDLKNREAERDAEVAAELAAAAQ